MSNKRATGDCVAALDVIYREMEDGKEPHPVFWNDARCKGEDQYPPSGHMAKFGCRLSATTDPNAWPTLWASNRAKSFYIPPHTEVHFHPFKHSDVRDPGFKVLYGESLISDAEAHATFRYETWDAYDGGTGSEQETILSVNGPFRLCFDGPQDTEGNPDPSNCCDWCWGCIHAPSYDCPEDCIASGKCLSGSGNVITTGSIEAMEFRRKQTWNETIFQSCLGNSPIHVRGRKVTRYQPQSEFCDTFMNNYCTEHPEDDENCVCFKEETQLRVQFPDYDLPVHGFGPQCQLSSIAYRTQGMLDEPVSCKKQICATRERWEKRRADEVSCLGKNFVVPSTRECSVVHRTRALWILALVLVVLVLVIVSAVVLVRKWKANKT